MEGKKNPPHRNGFGCASETKMPLVHFEYVYCLQRVAAAIVVVVGRTLNMFWPNGVLLLRHPTKSAGGPAGPYCAPLDLVCLDAYGRGSPLLVVCWCV